MIIAVDQQKLAWLLNENCSASIICVSFSSSSTTQDSFIGKYFSVMGGNNSGKRRIKKRAAIKSRKRASQTGNCGSVLVCNVNKGTLELKKNNTGNYLSIKYCKLFASVASWRTLRMLRANFRRT